MSTPAATTSKGFGEKKKRENAMPASAYEAMQRTEKVDLGKVIGWNRDGT